MQNEPYEDVNNDTVVSQNIKKKSAKAVKLILYFDVLYATSTSYTYLFLTIFLLLGHCEWNDWCSTK